MLKREEREKKTELMRRRRGERIREHVRMKERERLNGSHTSGQDGRLDRA